jgi:hypothetical protein
VRLIVGLVELTPTLEADFPTSLAGLPKSETDTSLYVMGVNPAVPESGVGSLTGVGFTTHTSSRPRCKGCSARAVFFASSELC